MCLNEKIKYKLIFVSLLSAFFAFSTGLVFYYCFWTKPATQFKYFPFEPPIAFQSNEQNNGKQCRAIYYGQGNGDGVKDTFCYNLQVQLTQAALGNDIEKIKILLRNGANSGAKAGDYYYPLDAATTNGQTEAVRLLLDNGADINHRHTFGGTALTKAIEGGHTETVELLLSRGANINLESDGETAIHLARRKNNQEIISLLQSASARK